MYLLRAKNYGYNKTDGVRKGENEKNSHFRTTIKFAKSYV